MSTIKILEEIRAATATPLTLGLSNEQINSFLKYDHNLQKALTAAAESFISISTRYPEFKALPEQELMQLLNKDVQGFYDPVDASPYVPLVAKGPWIVTFYGAVVYETGGYGMLGFGHNPDFLNSILNSEQVMANVMTRSISQYRITKCLEERIGFTRSDKKCPYSKFLFMNSGSESMEVAGRLIDILTKKNTTNGAAFEGRPVASIALTKGFHGRTSYPARVSDSSRKKYLASLASFESLNELITVDPNNCQQLAEKYNNALAQGCYIDALYMEPVMGEGNPGLAITPEFYSLARELTQKSGALLVVDSIQAALRAWGVLSIVDYPNFADLPAPDMETYSKALNAGQYPLSVLAMQQKAADLYQYGIYGNTMTGNPRALEIGAAVAERCDEKLRNNIIERGQEFSLKLRALIKKYPQQLLSEQATGLLVALEVASNIPVIGKDGLEMNLRKRGLQVIHGGQNSLRFTPIFEITSAEIDLIVEVLDQQLSCL